jgi:glycosyltransferase involved in cell wall biosynthesis
MIAEIKAAGVIVPARDEEQLLPQCLEALAAAVIQVAVPVRVVVALDSCTDGTQEVCRHYQVETIQLREGNVGLARSLAGRAALAGTGDPAAVWLASTDADSRVPPDWLRLQLALADDGADAVLGVVELDLDEAGAIGGTHDHHYLKRIQPDGSHRHVHGANIGVRGSSYLRAGGFAPLPVHEDRALVSRLEALGDITIVRTRNIRVTTSARVQGRCQNGFAADLAQLARKPLVDS